VQQITVIKNGGSGRVSGTFDGLPEGATLTTAGTSYHISYAGGDGNDVVLTVGQRAAGGESGAGSSGVIGALTGGVGTSPIAFAAITVAVLLVLALAVLGLLNRRKLRGLLGRRRSRPQGPRHVSGL
jgi:hypothetical protein